MVFFPKSYIKLPENKKKKNSLYKNTFMNVVM